MSNFEHIFFYTLLFIIFYLLTRINQNIINKNFWKIVIIPIAFYSIILGCRYGWGNDYLWYKLRFEFSFYYKEENFGFRLLNIFLNNHLGLDYIGGFIVYSLLYIVGAYMMIKDFKENKYMLAFFLPATLLQSTYTIRQSVGHSFVFMALHFFQKKRWSMMIILSLIAYSIHPVAVLILILYLPIYYCINKPFKLKYTIPIYIIVLIFSTYFANLSISIFTQFLPMISINGKFNSYLQNDRWYGSEAINEEWNQGTLTLLLSSLFYIGIIIMGYYTLQIKAQKKIIAYYNVTIIGFVLLRIFWTFEIFRRIAECYTLLYFVPLGYSVWIYKKYFNLFSKRTKNILSISLFFIMIYLILYYGRFILKSPNYIFFWNR